VEVIDQSHKSAVAYLSALGGSTLSSWAHIKIFITASQFTPMIWHCSVVYVPSASTLNRAAMPGYLGAERSARIGSAPIITQLSILRMIVTDKILLVTPNGYYHESYGESPQSEMMIQPHHRPLRAAPIKL
jgi:hypothetical protein